MREIEFRAWDNVRKILVTQENVDNLSEFDEDGYGPYYGDEWFPAKTILGIFEYFQDIVRDERFVVEQFTGLLDKNGTKIFEGDIVKANMDFGPGGMAEQTTSIYWDENVGGWQFNYFDKSTIEIIGNIHDNPELLEEDYMTNGDRILPKNNEELANFIESMGAAGCRFCVADNTIKRCQHTKCADGILEYLNQEAGE